MDSTPESESNIYGVLSGYLILGNTLTMINRWAVDKKYEVLRTCASTSRLHDHKANPEHARYSKSQWQYDGACRFVVMIGITIVRHTMHGDIYTSLPKFYLCSALD